MTGDVEFKVTLQSDGADDKDRVVTHNLLVPGN